MSHPLAADPAFADWIAYLADLTLPAQLYALPAEVDLQAFLEYAEVPAEHFDSILAVRTALNTDLHWQWLFQRCVQCLLDGMDRWDWPPQFQLLPASSGESGRWFFLYVFAAIYPHTRELYVRRGIPEDIGRATLADIGRHVHIHHARTGEAGVADPDWLQLHMRGMIFQIGRLQFERARLGGTTSHAMQAQGHPWEKGHPVIALHIPGYSGPLTPAACDASFAEADTFFRKHLPDHPLDLVVCHSWLMDRQLADYLPETSNIVQFQRRFEIAYVAAADNRNTLEFVFRSPNTPLDDLPQNSTLERAVVSHIRAGKSWNGAMGWMKWPVS